MSVLRVGVVGAGNMGAKWARLADASPATQVAAVVDIDPAKVGTTIGKVPVRHIDELPSLVGDGGCIGVIATPAGAAGVWWPPYQFPFQIVKPSRANRSAR